MANNERQYQVVMNDEEQYSIWPNHLDMPGGWRPIGFESDKESCLQHIRTVWSDMRPLSLRRRLGKAAVTKTLND
jgi:MbtH protein